MYPDPFFVYAHYIVYIISVNPRMDDMPRKPRLYLPDIPCHVIQRGNNRQPCFIDDNDRGLYINCLHDALEKYQVSLHAFVLMTNHTHLLMTPSDEHGISLVMQQLGRTYVRNFNNIHQRTGTLWEGRHKASLIDRDQYLLTCMRYIELNPVRAQMTQSPQDHRWSSYHSNALGYSIKCITPHALYLALGESKQKRLVNYRDFVLAADNKKQTDTFRQCTQHNYPVGDEAFLSTIEQHKNQTIGQMHQGRPRH